MSIYSEAPGGAVDRVDWVILIPRGRSSFTLPPTALAMFGSGGQYELDVEVITMDEGLEIPMQVLPICINDSGSKILIPRVTAKVLVPLAMEPRIERRYRFTDAACQL